MPNIDGAISAQNRLVSDRQSLHENKLLEKRKAPVKALSV